MSRTQNPTLAIRFVLLATLLFALQDGISKHLAAHYPVPWFVMFRYWFFALFVVTLSSRMQGGIAAARATSVPVLQVVRGVLLVVQILVDQLPSGWRRRTRSSRCTRCSRPCSRSRCWASASAGAALPRSGSVFAASS